MVVTVRGPIEMTGAARGNHRGRVDAQARKQKMHTLSCSRRPGRQTRPRTK